MKKRDIYKEVVEGLGSIREQGEKGALKHDAGKPQLSLNPVEALELMAQAFAYGAAKYGRNNFRKGHAYSRTLDAALRHLAAIAAGEFVDAESGNPHLGHALASLAMLAHAMRHHPELNDLQQLDAETFSALERALRQGADVERLAKYSGIPAEVIAQLKPSDTRPSSDTGVPPISTRFAGVNPSDSTGDKLARNDLQEAPASAAPGPLVSSKL